MWGTIAGQVRRSLGKSGTTIRDIFGKNGGASAVLEDAPKGFVPPSGMHRAQDQFSINGLLGLTPPT